MPATPPLPFIITEPESWYSFTMPQRVEGWVNLDGWLHTQMVMQKWKYLPGTHISRMSVKVCLFVVRNL